MRTPPPIAIDASTKVSPPRAIIAPEAGALDSSALAESLLLSPRLAEQPQAVDISPPQTASPGSEATSPTSPSLMSPPAQSYSTFSPPPRVNRLVTLDPGAATAHAGAGAAAPARYLSREDERRSHEDFHIKKTQEAQQRFLEDLRLAKIASLEATVKATALAETARASTAAAAAATAETPAQRTERIELEAVNLRRAKLGLPPKISSTAATNLGNTAMSHPAPPTPAALKEALIVNSGLIDQRAKEARLLKLALKKEEARHAPEALDFSAVSKSLAEEISFDGTHFIIEKARVTKDSLDVRTSLGLMGTESILLNKLVEQELNSDWGTSLITECKKKLFNGYLRAGLSRREATIKATENSVPKTRARLSNRLETECNNEVYSKILSLAISIQFSLENIDGDPEFRTKSENTACILYDAKNDILIVSANEECYRKLHALIQQKFHELYKIELLRLEDKLNRSKPSKEEFSFLRPLSQAMHRWTEALKNYGIASTTLTKNYHEAIADLAVLEKAALDYLKVLKQDGLAKPTGPEKVEELLRVIEMQRAKEREEDEAEAAEVRARLLSAPKI